MVRLKKVGQAITTATRVDPQSFNVNVTNGATDLQATRNRGAIAIIGPAVGATVTMALLYVDPTFHQAMLADDAYEIEVGVGASEGRAQLWRFPKNRFTSTRPNPGVNQAVLQNMTFESEPGGQPFAYTGFTNGGVHGRDLLVLRAGGLSHARGREAISPIEIADFASLGAKPGLVAD
jgi:hypothetical protein